jgi:hypothetical protein
VKKTVKMITAQRKTADVSKSKFGECRKTAYLRGWEDWKLASCKIKGSLIV